MVVLSTSSLVYNLFVHWNLPCQNNAGDKNQHSGREATFLNTNQPHRSLPKPPTPAALRTEPWMEQLSWLGAGSTVHSPQATDTLSRLQLFTRFTSAHSSWAQTVVIGGNMHTIIVWESFNLHTFHCKVIICSGIEWNGLTPKKICNSNSWKVLLPFCVKLPKSLWDAECTFAPSFGEAVFLCVNIH